MQGVPRGVPPGVPQTPQRVPRADPTQPCGVPPGVAHARGYPPRTLPCVVPYPAGYPFWGYPRGYPQKGPLGHRGCNNVVATLCKLHCQLWESEKVEGKKRGKKKQSTCLYFHCIDCLLSVLVTLGSVLSQCFFWPKPLFYV